MRSFPTLLLLTGAAILVFVMTGSAWSKIAIVESTIGITLILSGLLQLSGGPRIISLGRLRWISYIPIIAVITIGIVSPAVPSPAIAIGFASVLTMIFLLSMAEDVSSKYIVAATVIAAGAIALNYFLYNPFDTGVDSWGYLSVASGVMQTYHYSGFQQPAWPTSSYYFPFPVMSITASMMSAVTGLSLPISLVIFPGALIMLQPLIVYLLTLRIFGNARAAGLSALLLVIESATVELIHWPMAESVALSMMFIVMLILCDRRQNRGTEIVAFAIFLVTAALHALVALAGLVLLWYLIIRSHRSQMHAILPLSLILVGYMTISGAIGTVAIASYFSFQTVISFFVGPSLPSGLQVFPTGSSGLFFIWWGLPAALALCSLFIRRPQSARRWGMSGLVLLGLSFVVNLVAPHLDSARYGGLIAWIILAIGGGSTMKTLTRSLRQVLILAPLISLVCLSAVVSPTLSPQLGFIQISPAPTTTTDRIALDWTNMHLGNQIFIGDLYSASYSVFSRYQSGHLSGTSVGYPVDILGYPIDRQRDVTLFVRWSNTEPNSTAQSCAGMGAFLLEHRVNIIYNNHCDAVVSAT